MKSILIFIRLVKFPIISLSTLSAATGYFMSTPGVTLRFIIFIISLMILAAGSAALNQVQDREFDALMERTKGRPLLSGEITPFSATILASILLVTGSAVLLVIFGTVPFFAGILTVFLYNGLYTYLKRVSPFAVIPGALIGALPPAIGWSAAGGDIRSITLTGLMFFFYLWQIPHFWLLLGIHSDEYSKAGYPVITRNLRSDKFSRIIFTWITAVLCTGILLSSFGIFSHLASVSIVVLLTLYVWFRSLPLIRGNSGRKQVYKNSFNLINFFALAIIAVIIFEKGVLS